MRHPLQQRLGVLRGQVRRLTAVYGASWLVGAGLSAMVIFGLADYLIRFEDPGLRVLSTLGVLAALGWTAFRYLYQPLTTPLRDVDLARRLQRRFPRLRDGLASSVEFLDQDQDDPRAGSVALRQAVIAGTTAEAERIDFLSVIQRRPTRRAVTAAAVIAVVAVLLVAFDPSNSRIALARLANPFGGTAWPQITHLAVRNPIDRIARGQVFEVDVIDAEGETLPSQVRIFYRIENPNGPATVESELMRPGRNAMLARRDNVQRSFSYRAEGGDDHLMPWRRVEVLDPPAIESLSIKLHPPAYTGWPDEEGDKSTRNIRALVGTRVEITARVTKPLASAALCLEAVGQVANLPQASARQVGNLPHVPAALSDDGFGFQIGGEGQPPFVVEKSGPYWFRLIDQDGLESGSEPQWEIRAIPDAPPSVVIEQPAGTTFVTPQALLPIRVTAKDDLALQRIGLEYTRSSPADKVEMPQAKPEKPKAKPEKPAKPDPAGNAEGWRKSQPGGAIPLYAGPKEPEKQPPGISAAPPGESRTVAYEWSLADLGLQPGDEITLRAVAADYRPQMGRSEPRRLSIITPEELAERLAARQAALVGELTRVLEMQRQGRGQVTAMEVRAAQPERLDQREVDQLRGAELNQRQVYQALTSRADGVPVHILGLLADLKNNKVDSPDVERRMKAVLAEIDRLGAQELAVAGRELTAAIKTAQNQLDAERFKTKAPPAQPSVAASLKEAGRNQEQVILSLEQMLAELGRWDSFRRFHRDIGQLLREQKELTDRTAEVGRRTLTKEIEDLTPQDRADLALAGRQQFDLAQRLDRAQLQMDEALGPLRENDPLAAEAVSDALNRSRELAISGQMRSARAAIEANRMGQAIPLQQQIVENLREILDILANRREHELARLVKRLQQAEVDLANLAKQQEGLRKLMEPAAAAPPANVQQAQRELQRLAAKQQELQKKTEEVARRLDRLTAQQAAKTTNQAAAQMGQAGQSGQQGNPKAAQQAKEAEKSLQDAQKQLAQQIQQAQADLAVEQLVRLEDSLKSLHRRQQQAAEETVRLAERQKVQGRLTAAQESSLTELGREQKLLQAETTDHAEKLAGAVVFHLALSGAAREMGLAAALLDRRQTGDSTLRAQQNALSRLAQLLESLQPDPGEKKDDGNKGGGGQGGQKKNRPTGQGLQRMAEVKLLKLMQQDVFRRTLELEKALRSGGQAAEDARRDYPALSQEQGRLADLLLQLIPPQEDPEHDPAHLPGNEPEEKPEEK